MATAFLFHDQFLQHDTGIGHPENAGRLKSIIAGLKKNCIWEKLTHITPPKATEEELLLVHTSEHLSYIRRCCEKGPYQIDWDTRVSEQSYDAALLAAGCGIRGVDGIMRGEFENGFAAVRPPGHHATRDRAMGFCLFNNVAIAAEYALRHHGLKSVMIMDWDVHHGNGTQDIFYDNPQVLYVSLHLKNHYPGTGWQNETGSRAAAGTKINVPLGPPFDPDIYEQNFDRTLKLAEKYRPEFIFVSCGFDAHENDPLGNLALKNETYGNITRKLKLFARKFGHQRIMSILEGGYDFEALAEAGSAHVAALLE